MQTAQLPVLRRQRHRISINRVTGDVQAVRLFVDGVLLQAIGVVIAGVIYLATMIRIHEGLAFCCPAYLPVYGGPLCPVVAARLRGGPGAHGYLGADVRGTGPGDRCGQLRPAAMGRRTIPTTNAAGDEAETPGSSPSSSFCRHLVSMLNQIGMVILLGYGGWLALHGKIPVGTGLLVFAGVLQQLSAQVNAVGSIADNLTDPHGSGAGLRDPRCP